MAGNINSAVLRLQEVEADILEGEKTLGQIARDNRFHNTAQLRDFLFAQGRRDLWAKAGLLPGHHPPRPEPRRPGQVTSPSPRKEPVMAQQPTEATLPRPVADRVDVTYAEKAWTYINRACTSPKASTKKKGEKLKESIRELITIVDAEKEEVERLEKIARLKRELAEEEAKLPSRSRGSRNNVGTSMAKIRAWAKENYDGEVPERGVLSKDIHDAYAEAHREQN